MTRLFTSESVTPGHPDKVCDQISDAILDAYLMLDPDAHVAVEVMATASGLIIAGEVSANRAAATVSHERIARAVLAQIGYTAASGLDPQRVSVLDATTHQSSEIADGVSKSVERRSAGEMMDADDVQGAGDQGLMFGYATDETPDFMPLPAVLAHRLSRLLTGQQRADVRLRPDGKTQVTVEYDGLTPVRVATIVVSTQHAPGIDEGTLRHIIIDKVVWPALEPYADLVDIRTVDVLVNPSGSFVVGGPVADTGLTGRKIIVDTYGGMARHGGGAFSGKDPSKVDRSAAYAMRWIAKNVVAAGLARRCEVQVAYAIGRARPVGLYVETFGTNVVDEAAIADGILELFDLRPSAIIRDLGLRRPVYADTATFGHFGGDTRSWEQTDRAGTLRETVFRLQRARTGV